MTNFLAEELTAPEFARLVNAQTVGELVADVATFYLNRLGTLR